MYVNVDVSQLYILGVITAFADDTELTYDFNSGFDLALETYNDLEALRSWFKQNRLVMSGKTKFMTFQIRGIYDGFSPFTNIWPSVKDSYY